MKITEILMDARLHMAMVLCAIVLALTVVPGMTAYADDDDLEITGLRWSGDTEARWDKNSNCYKYQVRLYRNGSVRTTKTTDKNENYYDFSSNMKSEGDYHFEVRGAGQNGEYGEWYTSEYIYLSKDDVRDSGSSYGGAWDSNHGPGVANGGYYYDPYTGLWYSYPYGYTSGYTYGYGTTYPYGYSTSGDYTGSYYNGPGIVVAGEGTVTYGSPYGTYNTGVYSNGYNRWVQDTYGWRFVFADGSYPASCWMEIDNKFYCFNEYGYMLHDCWVSYNGSSYYLWDDGALRANQYTPDGHYVGSDGAMIF